jgi:protein involved in ribonucleotide reduction
MTPLIVYYSSPTENTHRFVEKLGVRSIRIPITMKGERPVVEEPYVLISPCYADDDGSKAVPKQVIRFLNDERNRSTIKGVIAAGNRNFGDKFGLAGRIIAKKCNVPLLYMFELSGTLVDTMNVKKGMERLWDSLIQKPTQNLQKART